MVGNFWIFSCSDRSLCGWCVSQCWRGVDADQGLDEKFESELLFHPMALWRCLEDCSKAFKLLKGIEFPWIQKLVTSGKLILSRERTKSEEKWTVFVPTWYYQAHFVATGMSTECWHSNYAEWYQSSNNNYAAASRTDGHLTARLNGKCQPAMAAWIS